MIELKKEGIHTVRDIIDFLQFVPEEWKDSYVLFFPTKDGNCNFISLEFLKHEEIRSEVYITIAHPAIFNIDAKRSNGK